MKTLLPELAKFVGCRIGSGLAETAILFVAVDLLQGSGNLWKLLTSILVVILNYVASKLLVFKTKKEQASACSFFIRNVPLNT